MTPAQLDALMRVHRRAHSQSGGRAAPDEPSRGSTADLFALAKMRRA